MADKPVEYRPPVDGVNVKKIANTEGYESNLGKHLSQHNCNDED